MRLSRGWYGLIQFWVGVVSFCGIGAVILQTLGSSVQHEGAAVESRPDPVFVEFPSVVPLTSVAVAAAPDLAVEAAAEPEEASAMKAEDASPEPVIVAKADTAALSDVAEASPEPVSAPVADTTAISDRDSFTPDRADTAPEPAMAAPRKVVALVDEAPQADAPASHRKFHLRIVRDHERCPKVVCYKWNLIQQRLKPPHPATVDLAGLRLAPDLREAAEQGNIELFVEAVEQHKTVKGRDSLVFVATNLAGVMPHDRPQDFVPPM